MARYFIDSVAGSDANQGTSKSAPWARAPGMKNGSGTAHVTSGFGVIYTPASGDEFVFKGGVTWVASFSWTISWANTTWGTDPTWFNGSVWSRAVFDAQHAQVGDCAVFLKASNITFGDGFDVKNALITQFVGGVETGTIGCRGSFSNIRITGALIRDWWMPNVSQSPNTTGGGVFGSGSIVTIDNCEITQQGAGQITGTVTKNVNSVHHCNIHHINNCFDNGTDFHDNVIHDCPSPSAGGSDHQNVWTAGGSGSFYNNLVYNLAWENGPIQNNGQSMTVKLYNNVFFNTGTQQIVHIAITGNASGLRYDIYNNTFVSKTNNCVRVVNHNNSGASPSTLGTLNYYNNHAITNTGDSDGVTVDNLSTITNNNRGHNLKQAIAGQDANHNSIAGGFSSLNYYAPVTGSEATVDTGSRTANIDLSTLFTTDRLGFSRSDPWDKGAYEWNGQQPQNQPFISLSPTSLNWGSVTVGGTIPDKTVTVSNTGTASLNWSVSTPTPYGVVGATSGTLSAGSSTQVTFRFAPSSAGAYNLTAPFSGAQGATLSLNGSATAPISGLTFNSDAGTITGAFSVDSANHIITETTSVNTPGAGGQARYSITIPNDGDYVVNAMVNAPDGASNSFWINFDSDPTDPTMIWDVVQFTSGLQSRIASWRGTGTFDQPQFSPKVWTLQAGQHQLIIFGREPNAQIGQITIQAPAPVIPPAPAAPASPSPAHNATNVSINTGLTWAESTSGTQFNVSLGTVNPPPVVATGLNTTSYTPTAVLANSTVYYWQVRSYINWSSAGQSGTVFTDGPVWSFTTAALAPPPPPPNQPPVAGITSDVSSGTGSVPVNFTLTSSDPDGSVASGVLNYGDGTAAVNIPTPAASIQRSHTYAAVTIQTTYQATWQVTDNSGATSPLVTRNITVSPTPPPPPNQPPLAGISANPTSGAGPFQTTATLTSSDPDGTVVSGTLDWGDGSILTINNPGAAITQSHTYAAVAVDTTRTATWKVKDNSGAFSGTATVQIVVSTVPQPPQVVLSSPSEGQIYTAPASVTLTAVVQQGTNTIAKVEFYQGNTLLNTDLVSPWTFIWTPVAAGDYSLTAKAYDNQGTPLVGTSPIIHIHVIASGAVLVPQILFVTIP